MVEAEYNQAVEVPEMMSRSPVDRQFDEARLKFLHDQEARLMAARAEGKAEVLEAGSSSGWVYLSHLKMHSKACRWIS